MSITKKIKENKKQLLKKSERVLLQSVNSINDRISVVYEQWSMAKDMNREANSGWADLQTAYYELQQLQIGLMQTFDGAGDWYTLGEDVSSLDEKLTELGIDMTTVLDMDRGTLYKLLEDIQWEFDAYEEWTGHLDNIPKGPMNS